MFSPGMHAPGGHRFIQRITACQRSEGRAIAGTKPLHRRVIKLELGHRPQDKLRNRRTATLRCRIKAAQRFQLVTEEIKPHRGVVARRENIKDAAAKGEFAGLANRFSAKIALPGQEFGKPCRP